jgi:hypothetical protein
LAGLTLFISADQQDWSMASSIFVPTQLVFLHIIDNLNNNTLDKFQKGSHACTPKFLSCTLKISSKTAILCSLADRQLENSVFKITTNIVDVITLSDISIGKDAKLFECS